MKAFWGLVLEPQKQSLSLQKNDMVNFMIPTISKKYLSLSSINSVYNPKMELYKNWAI
jgi:hypothetical protein